MALTSPVDDKYRLKELFVAVVAILAEWMAFVHALDVIVDVRPAAVAEDGQGHVENQFH